MKAIQSVFDFGGRPQHTLEQFVPGANALGLSLVRRMVEPSGEKQTPASSDVPRIFAPARVWAIDSRQMFPRWTFSGRRAGAWFGEAVLSCVTRGFLPAQCPCGVALRTLVTSVADTAWALLPQAERTKVASCATSSSVSRSA